MEQEQKEAESKMAIAIGAMLPSITESVAAQLRERALLESDAEDVAQPTSTARINWLEGAS